MTESEDEVPVERPAVLLPPMTWVQLPTDPVVWLYVDTMSSTAVRYRVGG